MSRSEEETAAIAAAVAAALQPGDVVFLKGELGAGKTLFIREAARALGTADRVTSPSYTLGQTYSGRVRIHHLDLYRLPSFSAADADELEPYFEKDAVTFIEWPDRAEQFLEPPAATVTLEHVDEHSRRLTIVSGRSELLTRIREKGLIG
jgi:tRNA threonylcarbamoyladenosine biosynthesis protein TsaE